MNKRDLLDLVVETLEKEEKLLITAALSAKDAATESEAKPENQYDTRGLEQSYLAGAQARRAAELNESIKNFKSIPLHLFESSDPVDLTAIVDVESDEGERKIYFVLPKRGGIRVIYKESEIFTLSPDSPLGVCLLGKVSGESFELKVKGELRSYLIVNIR
ncbi:MAG: transcription elongation factor GreAB [Bacteriovoracaceae bacterium]|nr:transcription elongation factor GreAB [Bacteriovoracaceae bacterium]